VNLHLCGSTLALVEVARRYCSVNIRIVFEDINYSSILGLKTVVEFLTEKGVLTQAEILYAFL
jgi:hypothetical protein